MRLGVRPITLAVAVVRQREAIKALIILLRQLADQAAACLVHVHIVRAPVARRITMCTGASVRRGDIGVVRWTEAAFACFYVQDLPGKPLNELSPFVTELQN